ncbi:teichoic acid ABC transporter ATP-binding protein [Desulfitobacterium hafniense]|uniref:Teichoic acid ABC transporter ATP-binding protein n=1 Tax=Desulfitobacterium hafniense TaxID=49338 RepID=A0A0W1JQI0_DESHA|nr:ABC transporter ATP-binding protein [Desulfitobacterium hafniense]KTE93840.1 teichoic acid ABC transporter ATP-binding protein [Desulfitobacterium hafniense]
MLKPAIEVNNVTMRFNLASEKTESIKEYIVKLIKGQLLYSEFTALKDVSFTVENGQAVGIVGANGSGKSTLLKCISGIYTPSEGKVKVNGSIAPLIELGAGFDPDLTAQENIYLNGAVMGFEKAFIESKYQEIVDFSELNKFMDVPVKNFSSGMNARLGFSIATLVKPEVLIVDEILGVGDVAFQKKCHQKMEELRGDGTTMLFVSHTIEQIKNICTRAVWLRQGEKVMEDSADIVCNEYTKWAESHSAFE